MATLQEQAARAWAPRRGVTVYSPTRPLIRPQGGTANAGTAARILQGRQPSWFNQPQGTGQFAPGQMTPLPAYTPPEQPGMGRTALDDILDRMGAAGPPPEQEQGPGGWRGVLGTVANSVPGKAIFAALDVLDRPRRAVASTINEGLDAIGLNAESRSDGDASWSDWWNQFNDPTFGFGDIVASTGNKWLDRGIGLAGDIAMDPLTYLVGTGVVAGTGARARVALAARAYGAGVAPEVAARTGRIGIQALSNVERRAINAATDGAEQLLDRGYRFKLPFIDAANAPRIPGTGRIEQAIGGTVARARNAINTTRPLSTMRYWRSERGLQDAIGKVLTGRGDISFGVAAALINYRKGAGIAGSRVNGLLSTEWNRLVQEHGQKALQDMVHEAETVGGTVLNRFYNFAADLMEKEGLQRPNFPNYIPHVFTDEGFAWIRNTPEGKAFHNQLFKEIDFDDLTPHMMQRKLVGAGPDGKPRVYVINGVRMEFKEGSIREINEQFAKAVPEAGFKLLDDDISNITARYSKSMSNSVAEAGGLLYLANQARGLVRYADDDSVLKEIVNAAETRKLNVDAHKTIKQKLSAANELVAAMKKQRDEGITALHGPMEAHLRKLVDTMDSLEPAAREELKGLLATQAMLSAQRDSLIKEPLEYTENAARLEAATNAAFEQIDQQYQAATKRLADIEPAFQLAEQQWLDAQRVAVAARQAGTAGVKSPPMSEVQKAYRKGVVELTQLSIDRDAAASINQRVQAALRKEQIIERNLDSDTFAAMAGERMGLGEVDVMPPTKYVDPDTGEVQWIDPGTPVDEIPEGVVLRRETPEGVQQARVAESLDPRRSRRRTPEMVYREHNARRARAIRDHEQNFPVLREYQNRIEAQTQVVLAAREDLFNAASVHARKVQDAKLQMHEWRKIENELTGKIEDLEGNPRWAGQQKQYLRQLEELKAPDGPRDRALRAYTDAQRPMTDAKTKYDQAVAKLEELKQAQNAEARKIRLEPRDILSEQVRGAGLRHIYAGREVVASQGRLTRAQAALADLQSRRAYLTGEGGAITTVGLDDFNRTILEISPPFAGTPEASVAGIQRKALLEDHLTAQDNLPDELQDAISAYSHHGFLRINRGLRAGQVPDETRALDAAFEASQPLPPSVETVYRGVYAGLPNEPLWASGLRPGQTFTDNGYSSVTQNAQTAVDTAGLSSVDAAGTLDRALIKIEVDPAARGENVLAGSRSEEEWILPRGSTFEVVDVIESVNDAGSRFRIITLKWKGKGATAAAPQRTDQLTAQIGAIDQRIRQAQEAVTARETELANQIATVDAIKGELDTLRTQRQRMDTTDYFAEQLTDINLRNRDVNAALRAQVQGRERYAQTANGRAEVVLRNERAKLNHAINEGDRQFEYWQGEQVGAPWRPVEVAERADGTYEVKPRWGNTLGVSESQAMLEMAEKRAWYTEHYIDGLSNELDVIASDIMRARDRLAEMTDNRGGRITKLQKQIDKMTTRHRRLTTRLERRRRFAVDEYDSKLIKLGAGPRQIAEGGSYSVEGLKRRAALIEQVNEMVAARNALVIERERINSRLLATGNQLDEYDKNIKLLRDERSDLHKELADTVKEQTIGVVPVRAETLYGRYLQPVSQSERNALQTAQGMAYGYKVTWEPVDVAPTDLQRYGVWTPEERTNLNIAYAIQQAWDQTPNEFRTAEFKAQRDAAVRVIRDLTNPNVTRGGASHAQHHLQMIIENVDEEGLSAALDELQRSRIPFRKPAQRSDLGKALEKGSGAGSRTPDSIARRAVKMFKELNTDYGEKFVQTGAISPGTMQYYNHKWIELQDVMQAYAATAGAAGGASPILLSRRDQLANDLNRFNEIMFTYRAALEEGGAEPSHSLAAFIAAERLDKESATVLTELQRTLRALGNPVIAAEDAALDARRLTLTNKVDKALYDYEELAGTYNEVSLGRALTDDEARILRNSRAKYNRLRKELEDVPDTPMASVLTDEVEHIAYLVGQYIEGISASFSDMKNARSIVHHQGSPIRQARLKEVTIEKATADINRGDEEIATMRRLIQEAQQKGENTITYVPWHRVQRFGMTPQELLDEIATGTRTKISQQQESRLGPKARKAIAEGNEDLIYWERTFTGNEEPVTVDLYTAINKVHSDEASMVQRKWNLEKEIALREAYLGRATDWINHYRRIIEDQLRPPNVDVLRGQLRDMQYEFGRVTSFEDLRVNPFDEVEIPDADAGERLQIQMMQDRIDLASGPKMTEGELETWQRKLAMYEETDANVRRQMGDDAAYVEAMAQAHPQDKPRGWYAMQSARDDGRALFTDIVSGARQATDDDVKILTDLFGDAEEAELSVLWLNTFNQLIDVVKHRRLTESQMGGTQSYLMAQRYPELAEETTQQYVSEISNLEATYILSQLRELAGDSQLNDRFSNMIAESVQTGGFEQTAEELEATARRYDIRAAEEGIEEGIGGAVEGGPQARGFNLQSIRNQIVSSLIESSVNAKNAAIQDAQRVMRLLGFDNYIQSTRKIQGTTMTGAQAIARNEPVLTETRLSLLGYSVSQQTYSDPNKLREFITDMLHGADFDHSHALRRNARKLSARLSRIDNMRRALGVSIDESANHVRDPDRFLGLLAKWREPAVDVPESGAEVLDRITDFNANVLPPEMDQIYADRISRLNQDFAEAVIRNDIDEINRIGPMIRELHEANRPDSMTNLGPEMPALHVAGMTPAPTEQAAAQVAAEAVSTPPMNEKALAAQSVLEAAQRDVDNARNALATAEAQMGGGGPVAVPGDDAPTQARTLEEFMLDDEFEMGGSKLTRAEVLRRSDELVAQRKQLPRRSADRDEAQQLEYRTITADLANLSARAWKEEPDWQVEAAEAIYKFEKDGTPPEWMLPTGEAANQETITRLRGELAQAEANLAEARSTADQFHLGPGDNTAGELADVAPPSDQSVRRAELQAQAEAARAAGDENAARWAEQQMGWLDEPEAAAQPARVDPVEQTGVAAEVVPPDELPLPPEVRLPDETPVPARQPLDQQFDEVVEEFRSLMQKYGPYENMPDEVKQRLAALSATARRLVEDRRNVQAADHSARQRILDEVPELAAYLERVKRIPEAISPTVASDWEQVIRNGPSVRTFDPMIEQKLKPKVKLYTGVAANEPAVRMLGEVFPGMGQNRRGMTAGNVILDAEGKPVLLKGAQLEASLRAQLEGSPRRVVQTARERLISRLNEIKAERIALQREGVQQTVDVMQANVAAIKAANAPMLGPELPELSPDELAAVARGEYERVAPEWREAFEAERSAARNLEAAKAARTVDAQQEAERLAREERTRQLASIDMDLAKVRTDLEAVTEGVADYGKLRTQIQSALDSVSKEMEPNSPMAQDMRDLAAYFATSPNIPPEEAKVLATLLDDALLAQRQLDGAKVRADVLERRIKSFGDNPKKATVAGKVMKNVALDGWEGIATKLLRGEDATLSAAGEAAGLRRNQSVVIAKELRDRLERVTRMMETPEAWKLVDKYTAFFKTYATGRPGFHVRNALSAIFMNMVDGVRIRDMYAGLSAWRKFTKNPREFWDNATPQMRDAITAVLASGAGGQFAERGIATAGTNASKWYRMLMNNKYTRFNQRAGTLVEGAARMGMAMNSTRRGQGLAGMIDRITKYHFNYRELSSMDVTARRYIPFWTFMSRNLPLQLEQMWLRPQMYLRYQSFVRNFAEQPDPQTPTYWLMQGAFTMNEDAENSQSPWYLAPDLPHLRVAEPFEAMTSGDWGKALLSDVNPLMMAPTEAFAFNKKVYTGQPIEGDYIEPSAVMTPLLPLLSLLGGTEKAASGQTVVDDRYAHVARSLLPPLELLERLTTEEGTRAGRQGETWARFLGAPVLKLTPELRQQTARGQRFERREQRQTQAQLARL